MRLFRPELADELIGREAFERLQAAGEVVCGDEVGKMRAQFGVRFVKVTFDGRLFAEKRHIYAWQDDQAQRLSASKASENGQNI